MTVMLVFKINASVSASFALVCEFHAIVNITTHVFTNVEYSLPVTVSSKNPQSEYPGSNAVNGLLSDFFHT